MSKGLERFGSNVGSPEVSLQASFSSVSFLPSFYEKGEGTVLLALTDAPELNILSWCPEGGEIRYRCFFLDVRDRSNITRMKLFAQCPAPGGTQYTELFFLFLWEATCLWKKEINMLYEQFSSPAGHRDVPESPALPCLPCPHPSCPCHLESGPEHKHVSAVLGDGDTQLPMERKYRGPRTERPVTEPHLLDRPANSSGLPQRDI